MLTVRRAYGSRMPNTRIVSQLALSDLEKLGVNTENGANMSSTNEVRGSLRGGPALVPVVAHAGAD